MVTLLFVASRSTSSLNLARQMTISCMREIASGKSVNASTVISSSIGL